ncbi:hypothetical protein EI94DRAFT_1706680 [Lactarius quietus]|nr:hypothetical protein EI94DRAFT_1706680 [Lactarius quietus]
MLTLCEGCRTIVKRSGLYSHFHQSRNLLYGDKDITPVPTGSSGAQEIESENSLSECGVKTSFTEALLVQVWPMAGGDGSESDFDAGTGKANDLEDIVGRYIEEEDDFDEEAMVIEASLAKYKYCLEPQRPLFPGRAGCSHAINNSDVDSATGADTYQFQVLDKGMTKVYAPFLSKTDWEIARWAKLRGPGSTAFSELMSIEGIPEKLGLSFKNTRSLDSIINKSLPGRPRFQRHVVTVGSKTQECIMICIRESGGGLHKAQHRCLLTNLYHSCMHRILAPLESVGSTGMPMMCGNGRIYRNHPIFAAFIGDYPKQILMTGSITDSGITTREMTINFTI